METSNAAKNTGYTNTYLVTGAAGFIGSHLVERLLNDGEKVRALDNLSTGRFENIEPFIERIEFILGDLSDYRIAEQAVDGVDYVLHQAAVPSVPRSVKDPIRTNNSIVTATLNLFEAARKAGVKRIVQASSSSVYGDSPTLPKVETMPANPKSPYAVAKYAQETYGRVFSQLYGMSIVSLRYFNVFGPRQDPYSEYSAVIPKFITVMLQGKSPTIYGDGETTRDFTYIDNVVNANLLACKSTKAVDGEHMNIACGSRISLKELVDIIGNIVGKKIEPKFAPERPGDVKHSLADIEKANRLIGFEIDVSVTEGVRKTVESISN
ncbi:SDR family oxidoreductase [Mesotoga sp. UBA5557]|uniref:SDR family oxidoreductase n=1 Tax=Mesotoga sp. UBA5557 TaxID=1946857 RepID=UPI0025F56AEC|nr:SDR family oxidoreductase [Mesotoga sp. UBA5557]